MFIKAFWQATFERVFKSVAQGALVALGTSNTGPGNLFEANVGNVAGIALGFGVVSLLTSISVGAITGDGPSLAPRAEAEVALAPLTNP